MSYTTTDVDIGIFDPIRLPVYIWDFVSDIALLSLSLRAVRVEEEDLRLCCFRSPKV